MELASAARVSGTNHGRGSAGGDEVADVLAPIRPKYERRAPAELLAGAVKPFEVIDEELVLGLSSSQG
jgi:hypothetical protein